MQRQHGVCMLCMATHLPRKHVPHWFPGHSTQRAQNEATRPAKSNKPLVLHIINTGFAQNDYAEAWYALRMSTRHEASTGPALHWHWHGMAESARPHGSACCLCDYKPEEVTRALREYKYVVLLA